MHPQHPRKDALRVHHVPRTAENRGQNDMSLLPGVASLARRGQQVQSMEENRKSQGTKKGSGKLSRGAGWLWSSIAYLLMT